MSKEKQQGNISSSLIILVLKIAAKNNKVNCYLIVGYLKYKFSGKKSTKSNVNAAKLL
jgi:hypothetical protein